MTNNRLRSPILILLLAAVFSLGVMWGRHTKESIGLGDNKDKRGSTTENAEKSGLPEAIDVNLVREVWDTVHDKYAGEIDDKELAEGVLRGIVAGLKDPYSAFADREETSQFEEDLSGSFSGIGVEIGKRSGVITVIAPLRDSPAEKAGIKAKDIIVSVDDVDITPEMSLTEVASRIRGPAGTEVKLGIVREQKSEIIKISVRRQRIQLKSITSRIKDNIGIIEISAFNEDTPKSFKTAVHSLLSSHVKGIVLDVRNNPGGILESAVEIAGHFVDTGQTIVKEIPANPQKVVIHRADGPSDLKKIPVVVIINGGSASAAEILAGALRDLRETPLVGERTFGKGSVQELVDLSDGSSIRITIAKWVTPSGKEITEQGLAPDVEVHDPNPDDEVDELLDRAIKTLLPQG